MSATYTTEKTLLDLKSILDGNIDELYKNKIVNWKGCIKDSQTPYTEVIIKYLLDNNIVIEHGVIQNVSKIKRSENYYTKSHEELLNNRTEGSNRAEEIFIKDLFKTNPFEAQIGKPIDFQVPLKDKQSDGAGKIDLLTFKEDTSELFLVEAKAKSSDETALKCCLEIAIYFNKVNVEKLVEDFYVAGKIPTKNVTVRLATIVFLGSQADVEFKDETREQLKKLVENLNLEVCVVNCD